MSAQYLPVLFAFMGAIGFMAVMLGLNHLLGPKPKAALTPAVKFEPFECGVPALQRDNRRRISVKYYLVAILFVMFDLEAVLLYPWAVLYRELGLFGLVELVVFLISLVVGLIYAWRKGALEWQ
ncbi:MAG TPA: NADH-quinone oxidoreductase subunit A [Deltaproteobacteria bacterium]|nr:NADH-quinone oxidoreductase subunit A [Deltaproteobacteria bacterium]HCP44469.1 NADH-quinone oxidoreductase subunit A [Deltaproteobacteria bacterium]|tara:strand:- start:259 stop:630 length:372 start_codon:yes stop_codon:yes gene_type:complete